MTMLPKVVRELCADEPAAANHDDLHMFTLIWMFVSILARLRRRRNGALLAAAAAETFSGEAQ